jgi:hypothetical protein
MTIFYSLMTMGVIQFSCLLVGLITAGLARIVSLGSDRFWTHYLILLFLDHFSSCCWLTDLLVVSGSHQQWFLVLILMGLITVCYCQVVANGPHFITSLWTTQKTPLPTVTFLACWIDGHNWFYCIMYIKKQKASHVWTLHCGIAIKNVLLLYN